MATRKTTFKKPDESYEHIRIAPIHHPKAKLKLSELVKNREDRRLLLGHPRTSASPAKLTDFGGPLLSNVQVYTIFWGKNWSSNLSFVNLQNKINEFFKDILVSPLMDQLGEYSRPGTTIGHGNWIGSKVIIAGAPAATITDAAIQSKIKSWLTAKSIPSPSANTLYFIYTDKNVKIIMGGGSSCTSFCGYHNDINEKIFYALLPFPGCSGCLGGLSVFDAITGTSSHELCEAITDPVPGKGWYDTANGEIGDICPWLFKTVSGYKVQKEWSNAANACI